MTSAPADPRREVILADLRAASLHARLWQAQVEAIGVALRQDLITTQRAIIAMRDLGVLVTIDPQPGDSIGNGNGA